MSYFQPLITSAFANYPVNRSVYADRASGVSTENVAEKQNDVKVAGSDIDRDAGKPKSASGDVLDLSKDVQKAYETKIDDTKADNKPGEKIKLESDSKAEESSEKPAASNEKPGQTKLSPEEEQQVKELKARDQEVRTHEAAHVAAGGPYVTGGPSYTYQTGPDGKKYAIGGEVGIDTSEIGDDPQATIQKMQTVAAAATAPAEPSGQDMKVAAVARQKEAQARAELAKQQNSSLIGKEDLQESESAKTTESASSVVKSDSSPSAKSSAAATSTGISDADETVANVKPLSAQAFAAGADSAAKSVRQSSAYQAQSLMPLSAAPKSVFSAFV